MTQSANLTPGVAQPASLWQQYKQICGELLRRHGVKDGAQEHVGKFFLVAVCLSLIELVTGYVVIGYLLSRAVVGCVAFMGFSQILPPDLALSEAQRLAIWDLLL